MTALEILDEAVATVTGAGRVRRSDMVDVLLDAWLEVRDQVARDEITAAAIRCSPVVGMMAEADAPWPCPDCGRDGKRVWGGGHFILRGTGWARRGFSLLELAVTLIVISAIAMVAAPPLVDLAVRLAESPEAIVPTAHVPAELLGPDGTLPAGVCGP